MVGTFAMEEEPRYLEWSGDGILWEGMYWHTLGREAK